MAHQMNNHFGFSVFHCVEGAFGASSGCTPKCKMGPREMNSKMVVVVVGPSLIYLCAKENSPSLLQSSPVCRRTQLVLSSEKVLSKQCFARFLFNDRSNRNDAREMKTYQREQHYYKKNSL